MLTPPTVLEVVVLNWLLCCGEAANRLQALFSMQRITSVVVDMDLKPALVASLEVSWPHAPVSCQNAGASQ